MNLAPENHPDPDYGAITRLYIIFGLSIVATLIPHIIMAVISLVLLLYTMIAAYVYRKKRSPDSLMYNHALFITRTIWIGGFLAVFTMAAASFYMLERVNNAPLGPCLDHFASLGPNAIINSTMQSLGPIFAPCMDSFVQTNMNVLFTSLLIAGGPLLLYFILRYARGFSRARGGYRISNPKSWF